MNSYDKFKPEWAPAEDNQKFTSYVMGGMKEKESHLLAKDQIKSAPPPKLQAEDYINGVLACDRMILARAITIIESNAARHFELGRQIIEQLLPYSGKAVRVGITGVPGAGKSTFIEALGLNLLAQGKKVAVLAVDPSSTVSKGSILGDKTRMEQLSKKKEAFIRPSPSGGTLGGVTRKSRETMILCEAAGFDTILVETVGVGQNETTVRSMVDFFLALVITGAGDDLQGIKKGILELADAILVNKADGANKQKALITQAEYNQVLHYLRPASADWQTKAYTASALTGEGVAEIWQIIEQFHAQMLASGQLDLRRKSQNLNWVEDMTEQYIHKLIYENPTFIQAYQQMEADILSKDLNPTAALQQISKAIEGILVK